MAVAGRVLVLEHVDGPGDLAALGAELATAHRTTDTRFGWHRDNVIGPLPQPNPRLEDWATFVAQARILPHLDAAPAGVLPADVATRLRRACEDGALARLLDHAPAPSLVHGDLWAGNIVADRWLIDPAVHHADREVDLAMLDLFGGVPPALQAGYDAVWPLPDGWQRRRPALQLVPLLVHVRLFGASYVGGVVRRLDQLGW